MKFELLKYSILIICVSLIIVSCDSTKQTASTIDEVDEKKEVDDFYSNRGDLRFAFYNVENLFDTFDDTLKHDEEFLPYGIKAWNQGRYNDKLRNIFKVMVNVGGWELPEIIGVCEIENRFVLEQLLQRTPFSEFNYGIIHEESLDARGIDVGFLYRRDYFIPVDHEIIRITFPMPEFASYRTRDLLHITGVVNKSDTLDIFICHFPSRRGGEEVSEPKRIYVAQQVRNRIDEILADRPNANVIVTGDFNDEPTNKSLAEVIRGRENWEDVKPGSGDMFNFMYTMKTKQGLGTYKYQAFWNMLDHFIVSEGLMDNNSKTYVTPSSAHIFNTNWLTTEDEAAPGMKPNRTYGGAYYYGGFSDHFPIFLDIYFNNSEETREN